MGQFNAIISICLLISIILAVEIVAADNAKINLSRTNGSDPVYWCNKGQELQNLSKYNESIQAFDKAIELDPKYALPWNGKGIALYSLGKFDDALKAYDEAIRQLLKRIGYKRSGFIRTK